jgi:hypothetical protein
MPDSCATAISALLCISNFKISPELIKFTEIGRRKKKLFMYISVLQSQTHQVKETRKDKFVESIQAN